MSNWIIKETERKVNYSLYNQFHPIKDLKMIKSSILKNKTKEEICCLFAIWNITKQKKLFSHISN